jgi:hypothetical protein
MLDNNRFVATERPANWANIDQLAQIKAKIGGQDTYYFLYWCTQTRKVLVERGRGQQGPYYWACGKLSTSDMLTHFHGPLNVHVTETWSSHDEVDINTITDLQFLTIRNSHRAVSIDCDVA